MRVLGLDLSLTSTGVATIDEDGLSAWVFKPSGEGLHRLRSAVAELAYWGRDIDLAVIEGPSYGSAPGQRGHHERAGLWWMVRDVLDKRDVRVAIAPPKNLKLYATGKGNASKDMVLVAAAKRFPEWEGGNDAADAAWLAAMGAHHLGRPFVNLTVTGRAALDGVQWPEVTP